MEPSWEEKSIKNRLKNLFKNKSEKIAVQDAKKAVLEPSWTRLSVCASPTRQCRGGGGSPLSCATAAGYLRRYPAGPRPDLKGFASAADFFLCFGFDSARL